MSNRLFKKRTLLKTLLKINMRQLQLHSSSTCIFYLNSGRFPYLTEDGSINIKGDVTITNIYPQQSTEETRKENASTDDKEKLTLILIAILLGTFIPICVLFVLCGYFVFHKRRKTVFIAIVILSSSPAVWLINVFFFYIIT